jgi:hypothetical protein
MAQRIKINALNLYVGNKDPLKATLLLLNNYPHAAVGNEVRLAHGEINEACRRKKFRHTLTSIGPARSGFSSNVVMTRDTLKTHGEGTLFGCNASKPDRIAPERAPHYSTFIIGNRPSVVFAYHGHASISNKDAKEVARAAQATKMNERMIAYIKMFQSLAYDIYVLGDSNQEPGSKIKNGLGPVQAFERCGLTVVQHKLEVVAFSPTVKMVDQDLISKESSGSDHIGTRNTFEWK